jgi:hypothetical protein
MTAAPAAPGEGCKHCFRLALTATGHCLTGCAIGEVLGLAIATALGLADLPSIALAVGLAFLFGYSLTMLPLLRAGLGLSAAIGVALVADTATILVMEIVDNAVMVLIPGAMDAGLEDILFWVSLAGALAIAFVPAYFVSYAMIRLGAGHATLHKYHLKAEDHGR